MAVVFMVRQFGVIRPVTPRWPGSLDLADQLKQNLTNSARKFISLLLCLSGKLDRPCHIVYHFLVSGKGDVLLPAAVDYPKRLLYLVNYRLFSTGRLQDPSLNLDVPHSQEVKRPDPVMFFRRRARLMAHDLRHDTHRHLDPFRQSAKTPAQAVNGKSIDTGNVQRPLVKSGRKP